jgi:hypothetical protein
MVIAAVAASLTETVQQRGVGDGSEETLQRGKRRAVIEGVLGEQGLAVGELHSGIS